MSAACFEKDIEEYKFEIEHMSKHYNFEGYKFYNQSQVREEINSKMYIAGMLNSGSYHLNPLKLTIGLAKVAQENKVKIFENTPIEKIKEEGDRVKVISKKGTIRANKLVVACNGYLDTILGSKKNKFMPINNYVVATEPLGEKLSLIHI